MAGMKEEVDAGPIERVGIGVKTEGNPRSLKWQIPFCQIVDGRWCQRSHPAVMVCGKRRCSRGPNQLTSKDLCLG